MNLSDANMILQAAFSFDKAIGEIDDVISAFSDIKERDLWVNRLGNVMRAINDELILPIVKTYPELDSEGR
jgi:hypothetical protein